MAAREAGRPIDLDAAAADCGLARPDAERCLAAIDALGVFRGSGGGPTAGSWR